MPSETQRGNPEKTGPAELRFGRRRLSHRIGIGSIAARGRPRGISRSRAAHVRRLPRSGRGANWPANSRAMLRTLTTRPAPQRPKASAPTAEGRSAEVHPASRRQIGYIQKLASQIRDFDDRRLVDLADHLFGKSPAELSCLEASKVIDLLQDLKAGRIDLNAALDRAA